MKYSFMIWAFVAAIFVSSCQGKDGQGFGDGSGSLGGRNPKGVYTYRVDAKTLTGLGVTEGGDEDVRRWAGVHLKGRLTLQSQGGDRLWGQLSQVSYGQVHQVLPEGWLAPLPEGEIQYQSYPAIERPFEYIIDEDGLVKELIVSKDIGVAEENLLKGLLSTLQFDTSNNHLQKKDQSYFDSQNNNGVFRKMETDVTGKCGTLYTVTALPYDVLEQFPYLAPFVQLKKLENRQHLLDITKTKDHADCDERVAYHYGVPKDANWEKTTRTENNFMSRSTSYRIIADRYNGTIYSAHSISKVLASPMLYNQDKAMVVSSVNMTLLDVEQSGSGPKQIKPSRSAGGLIYSIDSKGHGSNGHRQAGQNSDLSDNLNREYGQGMKQDREGQQEQGNQWQERQQQGNKRHNQNQQDGQQWEQYDDLENQGRQHGGHYQGQQEPKKRSRRSALPHGRNGKHESQGQQKNGDQYESYDENQNRGSNMDRSNEQGQDYIEKSQSREQGSNQQMRNFGIEINHEKRNNQHQGSEEQRSQEGGQSQEEGRQGRKQYNGQGFEQSGSQESQGKYENQQQRHNGQGNQHQGRKQHGYNAWSQGSSGSSESSDKWDDVPNINEAPIESIFVRQEDQQFQSKLVENLRKVAHEIAEEVQIPSQMPKSDTVSKLNILVRIVSQMNSRQLDEATKVMYSDTRDSVKSVAWKLYRDAVAQSGTTPAYYQIKKWTQAKKIRGEEAAQVIAILSKTLRNPTGEITKDFFEFSISKIVEEQQFVNTTAVLAATKLINNMHVNNKTAHQRYPTHLFGRLVLKNNQIVTEKVLPTLEKKLRSAIERQDTHKAQVYIEAIGNVGHPAILRVFAPYLEGKREVSTFLRTHMVRNLDRLAKLYPEQSRNSLFNIYKNQGDDYEVRVSAIFKLLQARPTTSMFFQMAESTHTDSSIHVRSAIQSAIKYASRLHHPHHRDLVRKARAALVMMNRKHYGNQYSGVLLNDLYDDDLNIGFDQAYTQIGSLDSFFPKFMSYSWEGKYGGWMKSKKIQAGISSVGQLEEMFKDLLRQSQQQRHGQSHSGNSHGQKFGAEEIQKILQIKGDAQQRLTANLFVKALNQERFFAIDEETFRRLPQMADKVFGDLKRGLDFNYTKYYNGEDAVMMFPLVMGVPAYITYNTPTLFRIGGNAQVKTSPHKTTLGSLSVPQAVNLTGSIEILYASNVEGKIGFVNTVGKKVQYITSGIVVKRQAHIPLKLNMDIDLENSNMAIETRMIHEDRETEIIRYSVSPFTSIQDKQSLKPTLQDKDTKLMKKTRPQVHYKESYGQETGAHFEVEATHDRVEDNSKWYKLMSQNFMSAIVFGHVRKHISYNQFILRHDPRQSATSKMIVTLGYGNNRRYRQGKGWAYAAQMADFPSEVTVGSHRRQQEMLQKVTQGVTNARSSVFDIGVEFLGQKKAQYALTAAISSSPVDERLKAILFFNRNSADGKQFQVYSTVNGKMPRAPIDNYEKALEFDARAELKANIKYGEKVNSGPQINIDGSMEKTQDRKEYLRKSANGKQCERQMKNGNNMMPACRMAITEANIMNHLKLSMTLQKVGDQAKNLTYQAYSMVSDYYYPHVSENWESSQGKGEKIELDMQLYPEMDALNVTIEASGASIKFRDIPVGYYGKTIVGLHPSINTKERLMQRAFGYQANPICVIDHNEINTFSNRSYGYTIGKSWNVAMHNGSEEVPQQHGYSMENSAQQVTVLVREEQGQKEVQINYRIKPGMEVNVQLSKGKIYVNGKLLEISSKKTYELWDEETNSVVLTAYALTTGESVVEIDDRNLKVVADGARVLLQGGETFRNNTRGLCGSMSGEREYDLATPNNCHLRSEQQFASTWALGQEDEHVNVLKQKAKQSPCIHRQKQYPSIYIAHYYEQNNNWGNSETEDDVSDVSERMHSGNNFETQENGIMTKTYGQQSGCSVKKQMQIVEKNGEICITQLRQPACPKHCRAENITKLPAKAVCRSQDDEEFRKVRDAIQRGENPVQQLKQHQSNRQILFNAPKSCGQH